MNDGASIVLTSSAVNDKRISRNRGVHCHQGGRPVIGKDVLPGIDSTKYPGECTVARSGGHSRFSDEAALRMEQVNGIKDYMASIIPAKRLGTASEIANGFLFLACDDSKYMLGSEIVMDGGVKTL